ncbi:MAG: hypothetical protein QNJ41_12070 [Xenococcaceae cyanobacterium MO_188.B32]|nr:hypothetical protein [Xenococcaceae cyanobacterium MO_188.B32]
MTFKYRSYNAREIQYDNSGSNLSADQVEAALDELDVDKYPIDSMKLNSSLGAINFGTNSNASGTHSLAIGTSTNATSFYSVALGRGSNVQAGRSLSFLGNVYGGATDGIMLGYAGAITKQRAIGLGAFVQSNSFSEGAVGIGYSSKILGYQAIAIGYQSYVSGHQSTVIGSQGSSNGQSPYVCNHNTIVGASCSVWGGLADANNNLVAGVSSKAENCSNSIAIGNAAICNQSNSAQIGTGTNSETSTLKFQNSTIASADNGICAKVGDGAPTGSPREGTLWVDRINLRLYVRVNGAWKYTQLI